jgi:hypothetical protein
MEEETVDIITVVMLHKQELQQMHKVAAVVFLVTLIAILK